MVTETDRLTRPCGRCAAARAAAEVLRRAVLADAQHLGLAEAVAVTCSDCDGRGELLTEEGAALVRALKPWLAPPLDPPY